MDKNRADLFDAQRPSLSEDEIAEAMLLNHRVISVEMLPVMSTPTEIGALAVKFALGDGTSTVLLLDAHVCEAVAGIVNDLSAVRWQMHDSVVIAGTKPN